MAQILLRLHAVLLTGTEPTFDGQTVKPGLHFRWSFAPELGFPPGGFWLCRRPSRLRQDCIEPPEALIWDEQVSACLPEGAPRASWGQPDWEEWQIFGEPFTLPLTHPNWPMRYINPLDSALPPLHAAAREMGRRLNGAKLVADGNQGYYLRDLYNTLKQLLDNYPAKLLYENQVVTESEPRLQLTVMDQLLMLSANPNIAKLLGLYGVLSTQASDQQYDYCLVGRWGNTVCAASTLTPGLANLQELQTGKAGIGGATITGISSITKLYKYSASEIQVMPGIGDRLATNDPPEAFLAISSSTKSRCKITLPKPVGEVDIQIAGYGSIRAVNNNIDVAVKRFNPRLGIIRLTAKRPEQEPIEELWIDNDYSFITFIGKILLRPLPTGPIGNLYAPFPTPNSNIPLKPAKPTVNLQWQQTGLLDVPPNPPQLVPQAALEIVWDAPARNTDKDPMRQISANIPNEPIGFIVDRVDGRITRLPQLVMPIRHPKAQDNSQFVYRAFDKVTNPNTALQYRIAAFNSFGVLGPMSDLSNTASITPTKAIPQIKVLDFNNAPEQGGKQVDTPAPGWQGGQLTAQISLTGADLFNAPQTRFLQYNVERPKPTITNLISQVIKLPDIKISKATLVSLVNNVDNTGKQTYAYTLKTEPSFPGLATLEAPAYLILIGKPEFTGTEPVIDSYPVYANPELKIAGTEYAPLTRLQANFIGQPVYLVYGYNAKLTLPLPNLLIPVEQPYTEGRITAQSSISEAFPALVVDDKFPPSSKDIFRAQQRWQPPMPVQPKLPPPNRTVRHEYFEPADYYGKAKISTLPFTTPAIPGNGGYLLLRSSINNIILSDIDRRKILKNCADPKPTLQENGSLRPDLQAWITLLPEWLAAYNLRISKTFTLNNVLEDSDATRNFYEHFYGGLLDDELRALADIPDNLTAFTRITAEPIRQQPLVLTDTVEGSGFDRITYKLKAVSNAANPSQATNAAGPYYTRVTSAPQAPSINKIVYNGSANVVVWGLSDNPETAGYLIYRSNTANALDDLRYFGKNTEIIDLSKIAKINYQTAKAPSLVMGAGDIDPRLVALIPEPRLFAKDFDGSYMAEIVLPIGVIPSEVLGVYRLNEYNPNNPPSQQPQAFNYYRPEGNKGMAKLSVAGNQARIIGLRIGLGRPVEVVAVIKVSTDIRVLGNLAVRRGYFLDGGAIGQPNDPNSLPTWTPPKFKESNYYRIVAIDRFGNRSIPSTAFKY